MSPFCVTGEQWLTGLGSAGSEVLRRLRNCCGGAGALTAERVGNYRSALERFVEVFGATRPVGIARVPGRLNVLGRHIDHRGGYVNPMALDQEVVLVFSPNDDDLVDVVSLDAACGRRTFRVRDTVAGRPIDDTPAWLDWTQTLAGARSARHDWLHKLAAPPVYLSQFAFPGRPLRGFSAVLNGNLPPRVGLSSSSAVVVASMLAADAINDLRLPVEELIRHCGVAEWYVGTRGGFGDHAAILTGRAGHLAHVRTVPELRLGGYVPLPGELRVVVFHSGFDADKTGPAGDTFNERTATYEIAEMLAARHLRERHAAMWRELADARRHLANPKPVHLGDIAERLTSAEIYELLATVPESADRAALSELLADRRDSLERQFATHREPAGGYRLRAVLLFGIAECARALRGPDLLRRGDAAGFGRLMTLSQEGDRVTGLPSGWIVRKSRPDVSLDIGEQPGGYDCSTPDLDAMVDVALINGALGAQVTGAGLGGSMMALVASDRVETLVGAMTRLYFEPRDIEPNHLVASPSAGAAVA